MNELKNRVIIKALSMTAAAAICCTGLLPAAAPALRAAAAEVQTISTVETADEKLVSVIVMVKGDALLSNGRTVDDLLSGDTEAESAEIAAKQAAVQDALKALFPELAVGYTYNTLINGFSCMLPENLIEEAKQLEGIADICPVKEQVTPKMSKAAAMSGFPAYFDQTGCSGEGQVIAVIDTELDVTHPMFSALDENINTALSKERIAEVAEKIGFNLDIDPEQVYISNKLPFVADYVDADIYGGVANEDDYHGTHVAGIAAGNTFTDAGGTTISGIAKDAQIVFMSAGLGFNGVSSAAAVAALEDAVKLGVDVVNMSFGGEGETFGKEPLSDAINAAEAAGVMVCTAAGNSDNGTQAYGEIHTPDNPDVSTMNAYYEEGTKGLTVASADNAVDVKVKTALLGDRKVQYAGYLDEELQYQFLGDEAEDVRTQLVESLKAASEEFSPETEEESGVIVGGGNADTAKPAGVLAEDGAEIPDEKKLEEGETDPGEIITVGAEDGALPGAAMPNLEFTEGEFEYVYCGLGNAEDFMGQDVTGKIALVDRGILGMDVKVENAAAAGAIGCIITQYASEGVFCLGLGALSIPTAMISYEDGQAMIEAENKVITFSDEGSTFTRAQSVSNYSSWGVRQSLELRPDIMGVGGVVESAAYNGGAEMMQGTSMATPYLSGCVAVFNQYLDATGCTLTGSDRAKYVRNLLMTTAVPYQEDDMYTSPRRQGAGLISMDNALRSKVLLTGSDGESKINLYDKLGDTFSFDITLTNLGDEDVTFSSAKIALTTDATAEKDGIVIIEGQQPLTAEAALDGLLTLKAGETRTENVTVKLDAAQTAELKKTFVNGFFAEGYLLLSGAENNCDISVPMLGFCGDWAAVPIFTEGSVSTGVAIGAKGVTGGQSLLRIEKIVNSIKSRLTEEEIAAMEEAAAQMSELSMLGVSVSPITQILQFATPEEMAMLTETDGTVYVSPNKDSIADKLGIGGMLQRNAMISGIDVFDAAGNLVNSSENEIAFAKNVSAFSATDDLSELAEGEYTAALSAYINYDLENDHKQRLYVPFTVDKTAPELTGTVREENGRTILTLTAKDAALDGIVLIGTGKGGVVGEYDPAAAAEGSIDCFTGCEEVINIAGNGMASDAIGANSADIPLFGRSLINMDSPAEYADYNFADILLADTVENGVYTVDYDITDLTCYTFTAVDKAYNMSVYENEKEQSKGFAHGVYSGKDGIFVFGAETLTFLSFEDGKATEYGYQFADGKLTLTAADGRVLAAADAKKINSLIIGLSGDLNERLTATGAASLDEFEFHTLEDCREEVSTQISTILGMGLPVDISENLTMDLLPYGTVNASFVVEAGGAEFPFTMTINLLTGESDFMGMTLPFFAEPITEIPAGTYAAQSENGFRYFVINEDGISGKIISQEDKSETAFVFGKNAEDEGFTIVFEDGTTDQFMVSPAMFGMTIYWNDGTQETVFRVMLEEGQEFFFYSNQELGEMTVSYEKAVTGRTVVYDHAETTDEGIQIVVKYGEEELGYVFMDMTSTVACDYRGEMVDVMNPPQLPADSYELIQLADMAKNDYASKHNGEAPADAVARVQEDGSVTVTMTDAEKNEIAEYSLDAVTAQGVAEDGTSVDLPQTGVTAPETALAVAGAAALLAAGAFVTAKSLRRKENEA